MVIALQLTLQLELELVLEKETKLWLQLVLELVQLLQLVLELGLEQALVLDQELLVKWCRSCSEVESFNLCSNRFFELVPLLLLEPKLVLKLEIVQKGR
ncbi:hypothetical protein chiPu_0022825, partial [Chiloscyllium punctatum]|nr:hypothetical protein [Chiloscyllium punctatum]